MDNVAKTDIRKLSIADLQEKLSIDGHPKFRAKQIYEWLWKKGVSDFQFMSNLSKDLRSALEKSYCINPIMIDQVQNSSDGTIKTRFKLHDGHMIESVLIPVPDANRYTVCVSTQVGCSLSCSFCATGKMKRVRNLDASEIYDQYALVNQQCLDTFKHPLTNVVYMGMGEPLLAYRSVIQSVDKLCSDTGLGISPKRITVSTAGIAKQIKQLAHDKVKFNLALSLHAADDRKRNTIMPINESNNLSVLMEALKFFYIETKNKISYEYIAFNEFNDRIEDAKKLIPLCKHFPVRVNIIQYNQIEGFHGKRSSADRLDKFASFLTRNDVRVTVRKSRGKDIDAACGQLANKN